MLLLLLLLLLVLILCSLVVVCHHGEDLKGAYLVNMKFAELFLFARYCRRASLDSSAESVLTPWLIPFE